VLLAGCGFGGPQNALPNLPLLAPPMGPASSADDPIVLSGDSSSDGSAATADGAGEESTIAPPAQPSTAAIAPPPAPAPAGDDKPRVYAPSGLVKIFDQPDRDAPVIGAMRGGQSVVLRDTSLPKARTMKRLYQCDTGWYPVEPRGFVCVGGAEHATLDGNDPRVLASVATLPDFESAYPHKLGVAIGAPQYLRIPTADEQRQVEPGLDEHLRALPAADDANGGALDATPAGRPPSDAFLAYLAHAKPGLTHAQSLYEGYKIAWTQEFDAAGRTWLLTPDLTLVPKDKVRQKPLPTLKGIDLKKNPQIEFPLAFFWLDDSVKFERASDNKLVPTEQRWTRHQFIETTMGQAMGPGGIYWETKDGHFVKYQDVTLIRTAATRPAGVGPNDKWVEVRVTWGYLIAYEGDKPVYVTAISPGIDGIASGKHATARGRHHVDWKMYSSDMSGRDKGKDWYVDEVPWVQFYEGNYALHGAWWHNDFGRPKSHGCINIAPADAQALFRWMDPVIPEGWYAVSTYYPHTLGTMVHIRH
jgi:hypothetical protein